MIVLILLFCIAFQVFLTTKKISPFLSLLIVAITAGLLLGMDVKSLLASIEKGVGSTLGGLALIICLGAALGKILEVSGAAERISTTLIDSFGEKNIQWSVIPIRRIQILVAQNIERCPLSEQCQPAGQPSGNQHGIGDGTWGAGGG